MKLQRRERMLGGVALGLVGLIALWLLFFAGDPRSDDELAKERDDATGKIADKQKQLDAAAKDAKRLADWQQRALPPDPEKARSLYQTWLRGLAVHANVRDIKLDSSVAGALHAQFTKITYTLHAQAKLGELVQFLYEFYSAGYLHKISKMDVKPIRNSRDLTVDLTIEAISLPGADSKTELPKKKEGVSGLQLAKLSDYRDPMAKRDVFAPFVAPVVVDIKPPDKQVIPPKVNPSQFTFITGVTGVDGEMQVWLKDRLDGKSWQLASGESFAIGKMKGTIQSIHPENGEVVVDFDGHRRVLHDGDNLQGGSAGSAVPEKRPTKIETKTSGESDDSGGDGEN